MKSFTCVLYDLSHLVLVPRRSHVSPRPFVGRYVFFVFVFAFGPRLESCLPSDDNDMNQNFKDSPWLGNIYRLHRFRSTASPVKGLTADILVCPPHLIFFSLPLSSLSLLLTNCAKACDSGDCIRARASISEVGSGPMGNICGGSARSGS